jgi:2-polyprenyl-3-methyl-5-hydroxy-6-metoxy-1,4-benzoquinol methylase
MTKNPIDSRSAYDDWHSGIEVDEYSPTLWYSLVAGELKQQDLAGKTILEIGCGRGGFACWLMAQQPAPSKFIAMDYAPAAVEWGRRYAERKGVQGIEWDVADIQAIPQPADSFDFVISCETIEHVPDPQRAVSELVRILKPGGQLLLTTPNYFSVLGLYRGYLRLLGRPFSEGGQPINNLMLHPRTVGMVKASGARIVHNNSVGQTLFMPGKVPKSFPNSPGLKWFGVQSFVVAKKP